jgi:hypothetical protein
MLLPSFLSTAAYAQPSSASSQLAGHRTLAPAAQDGVLATRNNRSWLFHRPGG